MSIYLIIINKRSNGSDIRWKAIPQMCFTVRISKSIVLAERFKWAFQVISFKVLNINFTLLIFPSHIEIIPS